MFKFYFIIVFLIVQNTHLVKQNDEMLQNVLKEFFIRRHVQTVTVYTCWSRDTDMKLLKDLSVNDISTSFCPWSSMRSKTVTWYKHVFLVDLSCMKSKSIFQQASNERLFNTQNDWILFDQSLATDETNATLFAAKIFDSYLENAYVLPDSGVFLFKKIDGDDVWEIWSGFRASKLDTMRVFKIGIASPDYIYIDESNEERRNFRGIPLKANTVIVEKETFFGFNNKSSSDLDIFSHMHHEMIITLSHQLNFKTTLTINNEYGWSYGNGSFSGLIGILQKDEIDLSAAGVLMRTDRVPIVDYTIGTMGFRTTALFRQPSLSNVHNILWLPFTIELWLVVLTLVFVFILIIVILTYITNIIKQNNGYPLNIQEIITLVNGALCQQGVSYISNVGSIRIAIFILFMTSLFLFTSYSASIAALIQSHSSSIKTIEDLVKSPMTFSAQISPYSKYYFEETDNPLIMALYKTKMLPNGNKTFTKSLEGMDKIRTEFHGFMTEVISAYKIIAEKWREEEKCGLGEIQLFELPPLSIPLVKNSGHRDIFKQKLIHQLEAGLVKRITNQWIAPKPSCGSFSRAKIYASVSIRDISLTLNVLGIGVCISIGIFVLEVVHNYYWANRKCKNDF